VNKKDGLGEKITKLRGSGAVCAGERAARRRGAAGGQRERGCGAPGLASASVPVMAASSASVGVMAASYRPVGVMAASSAPAGVMAAAGSGNCLVTGSARSFACQWR